MRRANRQRAFSLLELLLVTGLLAVLFALVMPNLLRDLMQSRLPESAQQMRALLQLTRANAMLEGRRHRIRFPRSDEIDSEGEMRQPLIEVEDDPLKEPGVFRPALASWARDVTLRRGIRCAHVRLGKPTVAQILGEVQGDDQIEEELAESLDESFDEGFPPLIFEPDGTSEWATFVITDASEDLDYEDLDPNDDDYRILEVILDGLVGLAWLQRPLYDEELEMMEEHGWPPVLRRDFINPTPLTEDNVLEIREQRIRK